MATDQNLILSTIVSTVVIIGGLTSSLPAERLPTKDGFQINTTLVSEKPTIMLGEPSCLLFMVENESDQDLGVVVGGDYRNRLGRPESFSVKVTAADGSLVPSPDPGPSLGGIMGPQKIPAKGKYVFKLFLPNWATFSAPGKYHIVAQKTLKLTPYTSTKWSPKDKTTDIEAEANTEINVVPQDKERMGLLITDLGSKILSNRGMEPDSPLTYLSYIDDQRTIPYFVKALDTDDYGLRHQALTALAKFNNKTAFESLKKGMMTTGDEIGNVSTKEVANQLADNLRLASANALSKSPYPEAIPFLISKRNDPYYGVRVTILHVLGKMKPEKAIPILQDMTHDQNKIVSDEALRYLKLLSQSSVH